MNNQNTVKPTLWTPSFIAIGLANFSLFFAFYLLLPILPLYLADAYQANQWEIGVALSSYTITALLVRPFAGYMVDNLPRKMLLLCCYSIFVVLFLGYLVASTLLLFIFVRTLHGAAFGSTTIGNSTLAIDIMPSTRRGEGIGYYGVCSNIAMAIGPTLSLFLLDTYNNYNILFLTSFCFGLMGLIAVSTIKVQPKEIERDIPIQRSETETDSTVAKTHSLLSLDRFFLLNGKWAAVNLLLLSFGYGILTTYLVIFCRDELHINAGTGSFFMLMAVGLITSRLFCGKPLNQGKVIGVISFGIALLTVGFIFIIWMPHIFFFYLSAFIVGLSFGAICPAMQTLFINLAPHNRRGTANSSYFISWDLGLGIGVLSGGYIATLASYHAAYIVSLVFVVISFILLRTVTGRSYHKNKFR